MPDMKKKIAKFVKLTRAERRAMKKDHRACADINYYPDSVLGKSWFDPYQAQFQWLPRGIAASLAWSDKKKLRELGKLGKTK